MTAAPTRCPSGRLRLLQLGDLTVDGVGGSLPLHRASLVARLQLGQIRHRPGAHGPRVVQRLLDAAQLAEDLLLLALIDTDARDIGLHRRALAVDQVDGLQLAGADPSPVDDIGPELVEVARCEEVAEWRRLILELVIDDHHAGELSLLRPEQLPSGGQLSLRGTEVLGDRGQTERRRRDLRLGRDDPLVEAGDGDSEGDLLVLGRRDLCLQRRDLRLGSIELALRLADVIGDLVSRRRLSDGEERHRHCQRPQAAD